MVDDLQTFSQMNIHLLATDTHYLNFVDWDGSTGTTLEIDHLSDGSIDEVIPLDGSSSTWAIFLPILTKWVNNKN